MGRSNWASLPAEEQAGLISTYYNLGREVIFDRWQVATDIGRYPERYNPGIDFTDSNAVAHNFQAIVRAISDGEFISKSFLGQSNPISFTAAGEIIYSITGGKYHVNIANGKIVDLEHFNRHFFTDTHNPSGGYYWNGDKRVEANVWKTANGGGFE